MGNALSSSTAASEQEVVAAAISSGQRMDPRGAADLAMIICIAVIYAVDLAAAGFALYNRSYPPIKCKSPILMAGVVVCSIMWFVGDIHANGHVRLAGTVMTNCKAFGLWVRILLGVCAVSVLIAVRAYGLHRVFRQGRPFRGRGLYIPLIAYAAGMAVFGVIVQVLPADTTMFYIARADICYDTRAIQAAIFAVLWATWAGIAVLSWQIRNIKSSFNESRESVIACVAELFVLTFITVLHYTKPGFALVAH